MGMPSVQDRRAWVEGRFYVRPRQAVILAGGRGERMRPLTDSVPKPMLTVQRLPFLEYQICQLKEQGFERVLILLGYLPDVIKNYFGDGGSWGVRIDYSVTPPENLTCSRISAARSLIDPCFLLLYCDNYWPMQFERLWARFCDMRKPAMVTVYRNRDSYSRGSIRLDEQGNITAYEHQRIPGAQRGVEISYAILTDRVLDLIPEADALFEDAVYAPLAEQGRLAAYPTDHRYYGVGSLDRLPMTELFLRRDKTIILDRDGVLNRRPAPAHYVRDWSEWEWLPGAREALHLLKRDGFRLVLVTNQPGINRGQISIEGLNEIHKRMKASAQEVGGDVDNIYVCPHDWDEGCDCRKPKPGMLYQAQRDLCLDLSRCLFVGDDERDAMAADAAECPFAMVTEEHTLFDVAKKLTPRKALSADPGEFIHV